MKILNKINSKIKVGLVALFMLPFLFGGISFAANDLLRQLFDPAISSETIIDMGENVNRVGKRVFEGSTTVNIGGEEVFSQGVPIFVKVTRLLLILVIALSVTMILYNGLMYIIQTGQGKEGKSLVKNVIFIVVGILIALFSVIIITMIQSVPATLDADLSRESNNRTDNKALLNKLAD